MAAEKQFENQVRKFLLLLPKAWHYKNWAGPYSKAGVPDILACVNGYFVAIEIKAANGHPSELQKRNIKQIKDSGGIAYILYPKNFEQFKEDMKKLLGGD